MVSEELNEKLKLLGWNIGFSRRISSTTNGNVITFDGKVDFIFPCNLEQRRSLTAVYYEVWIKRIYNEFSLQGEHIIDVGALFGDTGIWFLQQGAKFVTMYEPGITFKMIDANMQLNEYTPKNYEAKNIAVTGKKEMVKVDSECWNFGCTSFERDSIKENGTFEKKTASLADIAVQDAILKFDTEGSEYKTFESADRDTIRKFKAIMMEFHDKGYIPITSKLEACGFEIVKLEVNEWPKGISEEFQSSGMLYAKRIG